MSVCTLPQLELDFDSSDFHQLHRSDWHSACPSDWQWYSHYLNSDKQISSLDILAIKS